MDRGAKLRKLGLEQDVAPIRVFCKVSDGTRIRDRLDHNRKEGVVRGRDFQL